MADHGDTSEAKVIKDNFVGKRSKEGLLLKKIRVALVGCGTIGRFVIDFLNADKIPGCKPVAACLRSSEATGRVHLDEIGIPWVTNLEKLLEFKPNVVIEAATQETMENIGSTILAQGVDFIPMSLGAFVRSSLMDEMLSAAKRGGSRLYIPSGGIGALDALQAAVVGGVEKVTMTTRKYAPTWKGIPAVEEMGMDLDHLTEPALLFEGPARECVKKYPQNINIAAALSIAGIGFDKTIIRIFAEPHMEYTTHEIQWEGLAGRVKVVLENTPIPSNPKASYLPSLSVLSILQGMTGYRITES